MKVITVASTKGGVGKSTIAVNLAVESTARGYRTLLVDSDLQGSSSSWRALREADDITVTAITTPTIHKDIMAFAGAFDVAIVDCGGQTIDPTLASAIGAASEGILVVPVLPSVYDVWAAEDTLKVLRQVRAVKDVTARFLVNQLMANRIMGRDAGEAIASHAEEVPMLVQRLAYRESYKRAIGEGKGVVESSDAKAAGEIKAAFTELVEIIGGIK